MITTEHLDWLLYKTREEFIVGTNIIAISAAESGLVILDDIQMNNHHHIMGEGSLSSVDAFTDCFRERMRRFQLSLGNKSLKDWKIRADETTGLGLFRKRIGYIDRNAYVARLDSTPTGYPWGSGNLLFNGNLWLMAEGEPWHSLSIEKRRKICRSHNVEMPRSIKVRDGMILRSSFVNYKRTESFFNSANQYFSMLSRQGESDIEIARILGESIQLPNEEVFKIVSSWYPDSGIREMSAEDRLKAAQMMKCKLDSSNKQISQVLNLRIDDVDRMFPRAR